MYNLFVSANEEQWEGKPLLIELDRCIREYTDGSITVKLGDLTFENIDELKRLPCIFAYERGCNKDPYFGLIRDVTERKGQVRVEYEIIALDKFLKFKDLNEDLLAFSLDIAKWEMNRTHWAVKDVDLARELGSKGITLPNWARMAEKTVDITQHKFDVGLSFPGEARDYVVQVAEKLEHYLGPNAYFYDNNYESQLARPSLDILLQEIYRERCSLVVVFISSDLRTERMVRSRVPRYP